MVFAATGNTGPSSVEWTYRRLFEELDTPFLAVDPGKDLRVARTRALAFYDQVCQSLREEAKAKSSWLSFLKGLIQPEDDHLDEVGGYAVYVTGHSMGGFLAQIVAATRGCNMVTFAAPGALDYLEANQLPSGSRRGFETINFRRDNDLVGAFGDQLGTTFRLGNFMGSPAERRQLLDWARVSQGGIRGYFLANHSLEGIIHQFEAKAGRALTEPRPPAAVLPEETGTSATTTLAVPSPEVRIEAPSREVAPGTNLTVSAAKANGRNPGWIWTASAGTIVDLGDGNALFTAPSDAAEGTAITIMAEEASSSSSSRPGSGVLEVWTRRN
jgi:pimeloyl-ACP methyl ester carboxylesterase